MTVSTAPATHQENLVPCYTLIQSQMWQHALGRWRHDYLVDWWVSSKFRESNGGRPLMKSWDHRAITAPPSWHLQPAHTQRVSAREWGRGMPYIQMRPSRQWKQETALRLIPGETQGKPVPGTARTKTQRTCLPFRKHKMFSVAYQLPMLGLQRQRAVLTYTMVPPVESLWKPNIIENWMG